MHCPTGTRPEPRRSEAPKLTGQRGQRRMAFAENSRVGATGSSTADSQSFRGALLCFLLYCPLRVNARRCSSQAIISARTSQGKMLEKRRFEGWRAILQRQENTWKTSRHPAAGHGSRQGGASLHSQSREAVHGGAVFLTGKRGGQHLRRRRALKARLFPA